MGDKVEFAGMRGLWEGQPLPLKKCVIGSVKSNVGHLLTGAGAAGLMKVLMALGNGQLPPTANFQQPDPTLGMEKSPFRVLKQAEPWNPRKPGQPRRAAVSAFGFGGINAHVLIEEWSSGQQPVPEQTPELFLNADEPVAIVGMEARFGPWQGLSDFQKVVFSGDFRAATSNPERNPEILSDDGLSRGWFCSDLEIPIGAFRISPKQIPEILPQQLLMLQAVSCALKNAVGKRPPPITWGTFMGIGLDLNSTNFALRWAMGTRSNGPETLAQTGTDSSEPRIDPSRLQELRDAASPPLTSDRTVGALGGIVASRIAREFHIGGPSHTFSSEETSGIRALEAGRRALQRREIDCAVVGAIDMSGDFRNLWALDRIHPVSKTGTMHPFKPQAEGSAS